MAERTIIICDVCGTELPEDVTPVRISLGPGRPRQFDLCTRHVEILFSMNWVDREQLRYAPDSAEEIQGLRSAIAEEESNLRHIRENIADAMVAWGEGKDERARELLRDAASRARR